MELKASKPVALITGASSGIGKSFATLLAKGEVLEPHDLVLVARNQQKLESLADDFKEQFSTNSQIIVADLCTSEGINLVKGRINADKEPIDLLVNNAGFEISGEFSELSEDEIIDQIKLNVIALTLLMHAAIKQMSRRGKGYILNVSSIAGFTAAPKSATYCATKAFVTLLSESVSMELKSSGVVLTTLCPGFTRTEFQERAGIIRDTIPNFLWQDPDTVAKEGLKGLRDNKFLVIPGTHNKLAYWAVKLTPTSVVKSVAKFATERL
jgi:short-subunit dehydrogenase